MPRSMGMMPSLQLRCELWRRTLPRTPVNWTKKKDRGGSRLRLGRTPETTRVLSTWRSTFAESIAKGGGIRIFLEPRHLPIAHAAHVGEVTLPYLASGLDVPGIAPKRNDLIMLATNSLSSSCRISWVSESV
jgi:hypothetical protein